MKKIAFILIFLFYSTTSFAGFGYKSLTTGSGVAAPVEIANEGLFNLVVNVTFLNEPYEKKPYESENYSLMIKRLNVEWEEIAIQTILENPVGKISDLAALKSKLKEGVDKLIMQTKPKYGMNVNVEVIYSINGFFLVKPE